jgi:hypothetical protein
MMLKYGLKIIVLIGLLLFLAGGIYALIPHLKPNNTAFAPETPSSHVSKRLKGIFKGMESGFSN